jgi:hypothetical protein
MPKIRPLGHKQMYRLVWNDQMDGMDWDTRTNRREAHCKVCGVSIPIGEGAYWRRYPNPENPYRFTRNYLCPDCQAVCGDLVARTVKSHGFKVMRFLPRCWDSATVKSVLGFDLVEF